jgi:hypothetical protein
MNEPIPRQAVGYPYGISKMNELLNVNILFAFIGIIIFSFSSIFIARFIGKYLELENNNKKTKFLLYVMIFCIPLLLGGFLTSYFWNAHFRNIEQLNRRNTMIIVLQKENNVNINTISDSYFNDPIDTNLYTFVFYSKFQNSALQSVISSGLFSGKKDSILLRNLLDLNDTIIEVNDRIDKTLDIMMLNSKSENIYTWRKKIRDGEWLRLLRNQLTNLDHQFPMLLN